MQLAELLFYGVVKRNAEDTYPKKSEYSLTALGKSILPILVFMDEWGLANSDSIKERMQCSTPSKGVSVWLVSISVSCYMLLNRMGRRGCKPLIS